MATEQTFQVLQDFFLLPQRSSYQPEIDSLWINAGGAPHRSIKRRLILAIPAVDTARRKGSTRACRAARPVPPTEKVAFVGLLAGRPELFSLNLASSTLARGEMQKVCRELTKQNMRQSCFRRPLCRLFESWWQSACRISDHELGRLAKAIPFNQQTGGGRLPQEISSR